jgi:cytochrome c biogenesis protein
MILITYTKTKTVAQFYSDISVLNTQGNETERKTISVNYPLVNKGILLSNRLELN